MSEPATTTTTTIVAAAIESPPQPQVVTAIRWRDITTADIPGHTATLKDTQGQVVAECMGCPPKKVSMKNAMLSTEMAAILPAEAWMTVIKFGSVAQAKQWATASGEGNFDVIHAVPAYPAA